MSISSFWDVDERRRTVTICLWWWLQEVQPAFPLASAWISRGVHVGSYACRIFEAGEVSVHDATTAGLRKLCLPALSRILERSVRLHGHPRRWRSGHHVTKREAHRPAALPVHGHGRRRVRGRRTYRDRELPLGRKDFPGMRLPLTPLAASTHDEHTFGRRALHMRSTS